MKRTAKLCAKMRVARHLGIKLIHLKRSMLGRAELRMATVISDQFCRV